MRIKSKINSNVGAIIGGKRVVFPAKGVLELDDKQYEAFLPFIEVRVKLGKFVWLKKPEVSKEDKAKAQAKALAEAKALIAASEKPAKVG